MSRLPAITGLALGVAVSLQAAAAGVTSQLEYEYFSDIPIALTVSRLPQTIAEAPASVTIIDRRMIDASGVQELPDLFRLVAGFQVGHYSGTRSTVTYYGMSDEYARRMQVLVDGRSVYLPTTGGVDWFDLPLSINDIERIEVTRGPNGVTYGANAFLATINIITRHPVDVLGTSVEAVGGTNEYRRGFIRHADSIGDFDYRLSLEYQSDAGYDAATLSGGGVYDWKDDKTLHKANFRGEYRAGVNDFVSLRAGVNSNQKGDGVVSDLTMPPHDSENQRHYEQLSWRRNLSSDDDFEIQFYHERSSLSEQYKTAPMSVLFADTFTTIQDLFGLTLTVPDVFGVPDQQVVIDRNAVTERYNVNFQHRLRLTERLRVAWGAEARLDQARSPGYFNTNSKLQDNLYRAFADSEWQVTDTWTVNAGAMAENNDLTGTNISPRASLNYKWRPNHSVRLAYSRAYRTPAFLEEYSDYAARFELDGSVADQLWRSAGGLEPEKITSVELGLSGQTTDGVFNYDMRLFQERLDNLIAAYIDHNSSEPYNAASPLPGVHYCQIFPGWCYAIAFANDGHAEMNGIETQIKLQPGKAWLISLAYSVVDASGMLLKDTNNPGGLPDTYLSVDKATPSDTFSSLVDYRWPSGWQSSAAYYRVGNMRFLGGVASGGYDSLDLRLARKFHLQGGDWKLALTIQNAQDRRYFDFWDYTVQGRRTYLSVGMDL